MTEDDIKGDVPDYVFNARSSYGNSGCNSLYQDGIITTDCVTPPQIQSPSPGECVCTCGNPGPMPSREVDKSFEPVTVNPRVSTPSGNIVSGTPVVNTPDSLCVMGGDGRIHCGKRIQ